MTTCMLFQSLPCLVSFVHKLFIPHGSPTDDCLCPLDAGLSYAVGSNTAMILPQTSPLEQSAIPCRTRRNSKA